MNSPLKVHLAQYEGPLDLLLDLIRSQKLDIRDIPIADITAQYLEYIEQAREHDLDLGADFIFMAATLIHIKSRMLLPVDPALNESSDEGGDDPRRELVERLLEHEKFKSAAEMLQQKRLIEENVWSNPSIREFAGDIEPGLDVNLFDLIKAFGAVIERAKTRPFLEVTTEEVSVTDMVLHLRSLLAETRTDKPLMILQVLERQRSRRAMICLFLAVLELVKRQAVQIVQQDIFGEIALAKSPEFESAFAMETAGSVDEEYK